ncbi:helix-turn-helix domain-containing protein [Streptomyces microflavus]|uniref:helix-turn-helix domain-containing protein n=1 Tax=Streptomyces microflavus TaxID=1919 RepID=UPI002252B33A|nr:helix-turn-helix domain-containing protein [Streptomyces microflavus]MCX4656893.1 helix-turn-helix domain-containing protein [Streptomyces microflavus]
MAAGEAPDDDAARRLGAELRALQQSSGCTLRDLETRVRISDSSLSRYFRGNTVPPWATVRDLCRALGADPVAFRVLWEAADRDQPQSQPQPRTEPQPRPEPPAQPEASVGVGDGDSADQPPRPRFWRRVTGPESRGRWISATAGGVAGVVLGSFVTWFVLLPPDAPAGSAGGAGTVSDGAAAESGPGPSRPARIFVSRATGACLDHSLDQKLRTYACNGLSYQRWTVHKLPDGTHRLRNHATGACLDHGETGLRSVDCSASATQKWTFTTWPDDSVELRSAATAACLDDSVALGLRALPCTRTSRQKWG